MSTQEDLFSTHEQRPEEDSFILEIVERFEGRIVGIGPAKTGATCWVETLRPIAERKRRYASRPSAEGKGHPVAVRCDYFINVRNRGKSKNGTSVGVWQMVWSKTNEPLGVGLFESEAAANLWRKSR